MRNPPVNQWAAKLSPKRFSGASSDPVVEARLDALLQHLYTFYHTEIDLSLNRTYRFLEKVGNPHLKLPRVVHIAGTNGKGSTQATLYTLLTAAGQRVHTYTSPHLVHPTERIRLAGEFISSEALIDLVNECIEINNGEPITFFEMFTCVALLGFSRASADWLILETGMGGRLDTTNVVPDPAVTIITTISYDHQAFLGNTLNKIAAEKAGIMKPGVPCVIGYQLPESIDGGIMEVFHKTSQALSTAAPLVRWGAEWGTEPAADHMLFRYEDDSITLPKPSLYGNHQLWNAGAALAAFKIIAPDHFTPEILSTGLTNIQWPGRLQTLENHSFNALVPDGWEILIDGGHNDSAGLVLASQMQEWVKTDSRPLHLIVAMVNRKDPVAFLKPLLPYVKSLTVTQIENEHTSFTIDELEAAALKIGFPYVQKAVNARTALELVAKSQGQDKNARVLITGSLFLMGNILKAPASN